MNKISDNLVITHFVGITLKINKDISILKEENDRI